MRFMIMHKNDARAEAGVAPPMELVRQMGEFIGGFAKAGKLIDGAGLLGSKHRTRVSCQAGECRTQEGPYQGERELPAAMHLLKVADRPEALRWAERYGKALGDAELEVGKVTEPWDLGLMPAPANPRLQVLLIEKSDAASEKKARAAERKAALADLQKEMTDAGVLVRSHKLKPSGSAKRLFFTNNKLRVIDGPFAESKELIGGFAVLDLTDENEAIEVCKRYTEILGGTLEIDLRQLESATS